MKYTRSRYTLCEPWDAARGLLVNTLSGAIDIAPAEAVMFVRAHEHVEAESAGASGGIVPLLVERGYYVESPAVEEQVARWLAEKARQQAPQRHPPKYVFSLTLQCNLRCGYCWQVQAHGAARQQSPLMTAEMVQAAFDCIDRDLEARQRRPERAVVSLFGGEPMMDRPESHRLVAQIGDRCLQRGMTLHFATNGKDLSAYADEIARYCPSMQITADGFRTEGHGVFCLLRAGQRLEGLYEALADLARGGQAGILLRFLVSPETTGQFASLADAIFKEERFARNFTLAVAPIQDKSDGDSGSIPAKSAVLRALIAQLKDRRYQRRIVCPDWRSLSLLSALGSKTEMLPAPSFYHCEANVDLTCFGHDGRTYACFESIGDRDWAIGSYWPKQEVYPDRLAEFRRYSAFSCPECVGCSLAGLCGGGCVYHRRQRGSAACDDLHAEVQVTLRNWQTLARIFCRPLPEAAQELP